MADTFDSCVCENILDERGNGGADCNSSTYKYMGFPIHRMKYCYTQEGACIDGIPSEELHNGVEGYEYSHLACTPDPKTNPLSDRINGYAFKGEGFKAMGHHFGVVLGICNTLNKDYDSLFEGVTNISGCSGGSWVVSTLFLSKNNDKIVKDWINQDISTRLSITEILDNIYYKKLRDIYSDSNLIKEYLNDVFKDNTEVLEGDNKLSGTAMYEFIIETLTKDISFHSLDILNTFRWYLSKPWKTQISEFIMLPVSDIIGRRLSEIDVDTSVHRNNIVITFPTSILKSSRLICPTSPKIDQLITSEEHLSYDSLIPTCCEPVKDYELAKPWNWDNMGIGLAGIVADAATGSIGIDTSFATSGSLSDDENAISEYNQHLTGEGSSSTCGMVIPATLSNDPNLSISHIDKYIVEYYGLDKKNDHEGIIHKWFDEHAHFLTAAFDALKNLITNKKEGEDDEVEMEEDSSVKTNTHTVHFDLSQINSNTMLITDSIAGSSAAGAAITSYIEIMKNIRLAFSGPDKKNKGLLSDIENKFLSHNQLMDKLFYYLSKLASNSSVVGLLNQSSNRLDISPSDLYDPHNEDGLCNFESSLFNNPITLGDGGYWDNSSILSMVRSWQNDHPIGENLNILFSNDEFGANPFSESYEYSKSSNPPFYYRTRCEGEDQSESDNVIQQPGTTRVYFGTSSYITTLFGLDFSWKDGFNKYNYKKRRTTENPRGNCNRSDKNNTSDNCYERETCYKDSGEFRSGTHSNDYQFKCNKGGMFSLFTLIPAPDVQIFDTSAYYKPVYISIEDPIIKNNKFTTIVTNQ